MSAHVPEWLAIANNLQASVSTFYSDVRREFAAAQTIDHAADSALLRVLGDLEMAARTLHRVTGQLEVMIAGRPDTSKG